MNALKESFIDQNCKNGVQKIQKWPFLAKKTSFPAKKSCIKSKLFNYLT